MRKTLFSLAAVALVAGVFAADTRADKPADKSAQVATVGQKAPDFTLTDQAGKPVRLADHAGKIVVLEWFNEECPFVVKQYVDGYMNDQVAKYEGRDVVWLAVNSTKGKTDADNAKVREEWSMNHPILNDADGKVGRMYGATNTPHMYVIDAEGNLAYAGAINDKSSADAADNADATNYVAQAVDQLLAGETVTTPKTKAYGCSVKYAS